MHRWLNRIGLLLASLVGAAPAARAATPPDPRAIATARPAMTRLFQELSEDAALRARFTADPAGFMRERGLDPAPYHLPDRLDAARLDRVLRDMADPLPPRSPSPATPERLAQGPAMPVYGPPPMPTPPPVPEKPRHDGGSPHASMPASPQVAVYGPPPRPPRSRDRR